MGELLVHGRFPLGRNRLAAAEAAASCDSVLPKPAFDAGDRGAAAPRRGLSGEPLDTRETGENGPD